MTALLILVLVLLVLLAAIGTVAVSYHGEATDAATYRDELAATEVRLADLQADYERLRKDHGYTDGVTPPRKGRQR